jgi:hypothetical protein
VANTLPDAYEIIKLVTGTTATWKRCRVGSALSKEPRGEHSRGPLVLLVGCTRSACDAGRKDRRQLLEVDDCGFREAVAFQELLLDLAGVFRIAAPEILERSLRYRFY